MNNAKYLQLKKSNCKNCYKCIRNCPVKSIKFSDNQANIITDECILCGQCFVSCPQNAKEIRNDVNLVKSLLDIGFPVYASVAPSFVAEYKLKSFEPIRKALKSLGFADAEETAIGAQIVSQEYLKMLNEGKKDVIISSCCHTINSLIQKYFPEILPYLAEVSSPMLAHCNLLKQQHPKCITVFIGPCISKKEEAEIYGGADAVLTYEELDIWFDEEKISLEDFGEANEGKLAQFYPITGGIIRSMPEKPTTYSYLAIDGIDNCTEAFQEILNGDLTNCFIEMSACKGCCVNGPGVSKSEKTVLKNTLNVDKFAGDARYDVTHELSLEKEISFIGTKSHIPGEATIKSILAKIGKTLPEHELNCGTCGYNTCREKAIAVHQGKADLSMCLPYLKEKAENFSDNVINNTPNAIFVLDEYLNIQQINSTACQFFKVAGASDLLNKPVVDILDPVDYIDAMTNGKKIQKETKKYLDDYGIHVAETIVYDKEFHLIFSFMRDITAKQESDMQRNDLRLKTTEITDKVIAKQMRIVQEIASLLGETTAETKIALTQLKDTL